MIPAFDPATGSLPPGVHDATWDELIVRYGHMPHRLLLLAGLKAALDALRAAGCRRAYVDGSFVTGKAALADFDACWEADGVNLALLDPVLQAFANSRADQKRKYGGELFPADWPADAAGTNFLRFFQRDHYAVLELNSLAELPEALIRARIAAGLTQKGLAERLGLKEQQVQRYDATRYAGASLMRIQAVADVLGVEIHERVILPSAAGDADRL